jgi:diguanylate cyclase (GGDEF)-like protein
VSIICAMAANARETSGATTCLVARYVRGHAGEAGLARVHAEAGIKVPIEMLEDERHWFTYEEKIALFEGTALVLDDPEVTRHIGENATSLQVGAGLRVLLRTLGSPRMVLSNIAKAAPKFSTVATMDVLDMGPTHAVVSYELRSDKVPHRLDCLYNQGLISVIGPLFGLPLLEIEHPECQVLGAPRCVYRVEWPRWHRVRRGDREVLLVDQSAALAAQLQAFHSTAADLVSADDISQVLERLVVRAGVAVSAPRYLLAVHDLDGRVLISSDGFGSPADERRVAADLLAGRDMGDRALVQKVASARRDYGVIAAFYYAHSFFDYERDLLEAYARNAAAALDMVTALDEARRRSSETAALLRLANSLAELGSPEEVAEQVAEAMRSVMAAQAAIVLLIEEGQVVIRGVKGLSAIAAARLVGSHVEVGSDEPLMEWLAAPGPRLVLRDTESEVVRTMASALGVDAMLLVPIRRRGQLLGASAAGFVGTPPDSAASISLSLAVADNAAIALDNARLLAKLTYQARHDDLTGVASPSHFEEETERALARAARDHSDVSMVFLDVDHFKKINDAFGHIIGDDVLRVVALRLRSLLRAGDVVGRLGGDEFAVVLCGTEHRQAIQTADRIRQVVEQPISAHPEVAISVSIGTATITAGRGSYHDLLNRSDKGMYLAKHAGRRAGPALG